MLAIVFIIVLCSALIGFLGRKRRFGFWGFFFASILFSPIVGLLMLVAGERNRDRLTEDR